MQWQLLCRASCSPVCLAFFSFFLIIFRATPLKFTIFSQFFEKNSEWIVAPKKICESFILCCTREPCTHGMILTYTLSWHPYLYFLSMLDILVCD